MTGSLEHFLGRLENAKRRRPGAGEAARALRSLRSRAFSDASSLIRFHDAVLFLRAYPHSRAVLRLCEKILSTVLLRVENLAASGADLSAFDHPEVSGISGMSVTTDYSYDVVRWLKKRFGKRVAIDWEGYEADDRLRAALPAFLPLLAEEALEDANVPYRDYLRAARLRQGFGGQDDLSWLLDRIDSLAMPAGEKAERYESLGLSVVWKLGGGRATRTRMRRPARRIFFHDEPLMTRRDVSLAEELASSPLPIRRLSRREGSATLETAREAMALRYREYYAFTYGDPGSVLQADVGRGLEITLVGVEADRRLPLRASYGGFLVKNGVPIGYFEALAFFERMEVGFNLYYAFREGESAWTFARSLKFLRQALGVTSFSLDPYQIGYENEEAITSGAFWFYRKLGFRSTDQQLRTLTAREETKLAADRAYRTPSSVLRRLAAHNLLYEVERPLTLTLSRREREKSRGSRVESSEGPWDRFHVRNIALAVVRRMAREFGGDAARIRSTSQMRVANALGAAAGRWSTDERRVFADLAPVLDLIPDLPRWPKGERDAVAEVVRAKAGRLESRYLRLMQKHVRLREALLDLGSR
jgi:hypothetical protein